MARYLSATIGIAMVVSVAVATQEQPQAKPTPAPTATPDPSAPREVEVGPTPRPVPQVRTNRLSGIAASVKLKRTNGDKTVVDNIPADVDAGMALETGVKFNPPTYLKEVSARHEGSDGLRVFVTFGDAELNPTVAEGELTIFVFKRYRYFINTRMVEEWGSVHTVRRTLSRSDFRDSGLGPRFDTGRLPYAEMDHPPKVGDDGKVVVILKAWIGDDLRGEDSFYF